MSGERRHADGRAAGWRPGGWFWTGISAVAAGVVAAASTATIVVVVARMAVTPPRGRTEDERILRVDDDSITLAATSESMLAGRYGLWFAQGEGHARFGAVRSRDADSVTRELLGVDFGDLGAAKRGRISGWLHLTPSTLGVPHDAVEIPTALGPAPAWLVPAASGSEDWVIQVHGRGVTRSEPLRAVEVFRAAGFTSLLVSYRNDGDAPETVDHRYRLGDTEWEDVDAAVGWALDHGARRIVLMGWSMGGAIVLQAAARGIHRDRIAGMVLESPVVDWRTTLHFQAAAMGMPRPLRLAAMRLLGAPRWHRLTGQREVIDLDRLDRVRHASELTTPVLLLHSDDDGYVPSTASHALAAARPDLVTFHAWTDARHTKLWNADPARFDREIAEWLATLPPSDAPDA